MINFEFLVLGMGLGGAVAWLIIFFSWDKLTKKYDFKKAKMIDKVVPIIAAVLFGLLLGYAGRTQVKKGNYPHQRCEICGSIVNQGYKVKYNFGTLYYCKKDENYVGIYDKGYKSSTSKKKTDTYGHDEFDAEVIAEKKVKEKLKSPSTAKFCSHEEYTISVSGNTWTVSGYVDAQNSFGATLRNTFTIKFTFTNSENYTVDSCTIK